MLWNRHSRAWGVVRAELGVLLGEQVIPKQRL